MKKAKKKAVAKPRISASSKKTAESKAQPIPPKIFAQASPKSIGGVSMFELPAASNLFSDMSLDPMPQINSDNVVNFFSEDALIRKAVVRLSEAGFDILQVSRTTINIAGSRTTYEKAFKTTLFSEQRPAIKEQGKKDVAEFIDCPDTDLPGLISTKDTPFADLLEGVAIEEPRYFMAPSMYAPLKSYWHLRVPGDISLGCNADKAHRGGITGKGVKVAMVDSGWFKHPYFVGRGYNFSPVVLGPGATLPLKDESGHGTGESANIFSVAPDVNFMPVKMSFVNSIGAFNAAAALNPHIITCSWGSSKQFGPLSAADSALAAAIATAVVRGIIVVFSAGNGHWGFPGQHPDVISAGGTFMNPNETLRASDYASGFMSNIYPGRRVPDLCGLVGMKPKAIYIMLPIEPGDEIDATPVASGGLQGGVHPNGDETTAIDGWGAFSGTSAAAPQLAGAAALVKQACPGLNPAQVRDILKVTARDVTSGNCSTSTGGSAAIVGPDNATGNGLVDAYKAVLRAKVLCTPVVPPNTNFASQAPNTLVTPITPVAPPNPSSSFLSAETSGGQQLSGIYGNLTTQDISGIDDMISNSEINLSDLA
jgi:hypothetical protein